MSEVFNPDEFKRELNKRKFTFNTESGAYPGAYFSKGAGYLKKMDRTESLKT